MNEEGLAAQGSQQMMSQVVEALRQGISPEELVQRGVPQELIQAAVQILQQEAQAQQMPQEQMGLAGSQMAQGRV